MNNDGLKNISKQHKEDLKSLIESLDEIKPRITCTGILNAGKSTLLNALIGDIDNKTFSTADIRETIESKSVNHNKLSYIDTPGLDATVKDTKVVIDALKEADIVLFVHNINTGEFDPIEFDFLKLILKNWNDPKAFISQTIFVLSKIDAIDAEDEEAELKIIEDTTNKIKSQIISLFNCEPRIIAISAESYQESIRENEKILFDYSNFSFLKKNIEDLSELYSSKIYQNKIERIDKKIKETKEFLEHEKEKLIDEKNTLNEKNKKVKDAFKKDINFLNDALKIKEQKYKGI